MTDSEIINCLGGPSKVAKMLGLRSPSIYGWFETGIPYGRLVELAAQLEKMSGGRFTRRNHWPDSYAFYWPELAAAPASTAQAATETVALQEI